MAKFDVESALLAWHEVARQLFYMIWLFPLDYALPGSSSLLLQIY